MKFRSFTDGTAIQVNRSPSLYKCQCLESWNSENAERKRNHTLRCGMLQTQNSLFRIIHSVNQLSIYGAVSNRCEELGLIADEKGQEKFSTKENPWTKTNIEREFTRSELFGVISKTSIRNQTVGKHSRLRITVRDCSIHKGLRTRIVLVLGIGWYEIPDQTWRGRRFRRSHPIMPRTHTSSSIPTIQNSCSNSWRNNCWTSHWSSRRTSVWHSK